MVYVSKLRLIYKSYRVSPQAHNKKEYGYKKYNRMKINEIEFKRHKYYVGFWERLYIKYIKIPKRIKEYRRFFSNPYYAKHDGVFLEEKIEELIVLKKTI